MSAVAVRFDGIAAPVRPFPSFSPTDDDRRGFGVKSAARFVLDARVPSGSESRRLRDRR
jgi:hypothetical protein